MADIIIGPTGLALDVIGVRLGHSRQGELQECIITPGGSQLNLAYGLSVLGHCVKIIGYFSDDPIGQICLQDLVQHGIDVTHMIRKEGVTYTAFVLTEPDVPRRTIFANTRGLCGSELLKDRKRFFGELERAGAADFYGMLAAAPQNLNELDVYIRLFRTAREKKMCTFLEPPEDPEALHMEILQPLFPYIDLFLPGQKELELLTGTDDYYRGMRIIRENGCKNVVCKLGAEGCCASSGKEELFVPGYTVKVQDLTGAGDGFAAGLLHGLAKKQTLAEAADFANRYAASNISKLGPRAGMKCEETIMENVTR